MHLVHVRCADILFGGLLQLPGYCVCFGFGVEMVECFQSGVLRQDRLVDLYLNKEMISVNQQYTSAYAGGRLWSAPGGQEVWGKPLETPANGMAIVVFNRVRSRPEA